MTTNANNEGVMFTITTGMATNKQGSTVLQLHYYDPMQDRSVANGIHRALSLQGTKAKDEVKRKLNSSTANSDLAHGLGIWETRNITVPDGTTFVARYGIRTAGSMSQEEIYIPLILSHKAPFCEALFPVITDSRSTLGRLEMQGRFYIPTAAEFNEKFHKGNPWRSKVEKCMESVGLDDDTGWAFTDHTKDLLRASASAQEEIPWLVVSAGGRDVTVTLRHIAAGDKSNDKVSVAKTKVGTSTGNGKNVVISKKRRKISL